MAAPNKRILVVEDEFMIAMHIEDTLGQLGHQVCLAADVGEARTYLDAGGIDLAIVDYHLQGSTTCGLVQRLNDLKVPFIVCSGTAGLEELGEAFQNSRFLAKPFTTDGLLAAVENAAANSH
ncbi:response regulator [Devosia sp. Root105]|uniref:response regulator n=1 Tax=Devosia sp. Root105 TaxID=1736423 RepID=UPI000A74E9C5|nr:response regulator [Devosia sp. Root105]